VARKRPTASDVPPPTLVCLDGGVVDPASPQLTRAEAHALRRSAPLTHHQLGAHLRGVGELPPLRSV
jgi:hypothetical protein